MDEQEYEQQETVVKKPALFGMILEPRKQLERLKDNPKILVPFIIVTILTTIGMFVMMSQIDFIANDPELSKMPEDELMLVTIMTQVIFAITGIIVPAFSIAVSSLIYFIVAKIVKSEVSFKQLFSMNTFIYMISVFGLLVNAFAFFGMSNPDPDTYLTSLNSMIGEKGALGALFLSIEVFSIWSMIITVMGLQIVARFSKGLSWGLIIGIFVVMTGFSMMTAGFSDMIGAL